MPRKHVELDNRMKQLLRELGRAINESVADSPRVNHTIRRIKASGYDVFLMLDAVVAMNKKPEEVPSARPRSLTQQDRRFLKSLKIRLEEEGVETPPEGKLTITPQDVKFLKSLRINVDDLH